MGDVIELTPLRKQHNQSAIELLEMALEEARAGDVAAVCISVVRNDGAANAYISDTDQVGTLLGAITLAQVRIVNELDNVLKG